MKLLLAEDEITLLRLMEFKLRKEGHEIIIAHDGREALNLLKKEEFDIIITDIMMPFVSGLEIISFVRLKLQKSTPIIVLSAIGLEDTVEQAFSLGADDFLTKPFSPDELSMRVKRIIV